MAIALKGTLSGVGADGSGTWDISSLGVAAGDLIIIGIVHGGSFQADQSAPSVTADVSGSLSPPDADLYANDTNDANAWAFHIIATGADTSITSSANTAQHAWVVRAYSGVDATTPLDVAVTTATGLNGCRADPASITPTTASAKIVAIYAASQGTLDAWTAPSNMSNFVQELGATPRGHIAIADANWTSGAFDPAAVTGGTTSTSDAWAAVTLALRPGVTSQSLTPSLFSNSQSFFSPAASSSYALTPGLFSNSQSFFVPTAHAAKALTAPLLSNSQTFYSAGITQTQVLAPALFDATYGEEQVVNGTFDTDASNWTDLNGNLTVSVVGGRVRMTIADPTGGTKVGILSQTVTVQPGQQCTVTADIFLGTGSTALVRVGSSQGGFEYGSLHAGDSVTFFPTSENVYISLLTNGTTGQYGEFDNVSLKPRQLFVPSLGSKLLPPRVFSGTGFFPPIVHYGNTLQPSLYTNNQSLFSPTAHATASLVPSLLTNGASFYAATVERGAVSASPSLFTATVSIFAPTAQPTYSLQPPLLTQAQAFYAPTATKGAVALSPPALASAPSFPSATISAGDSFLFATLLDSSATFHTPAVVSVYPLIPPLISAPEQFLAGTVTTSYALTASRLSNAQSFYSASVALPVLPLFPPLLYASGASGSSGASIMVFTL